MSTQDFPLGTDDLRLLAEIGFIGAQTGKISAARAIFESLRVVRPESTVPFIGLTMADISASRSDEAARRLRDEALKAHPGDGELMAFLGLALKCAGHNVEAQKVLAELVALQGDSDAPHVAMATKLLAGKASSVVAAS